MTDQPVPGVAEFARAAAVPDGADYPLLDAGTVGRTGETAGQGG
jgi:hypothetical protein